jgi:hypothetical protein
MMDLGSLIIDSFDGLVSRMSGVPTAVLRSEGRIRADCTTDLAGRGPCRFVDRKVDRSLFHRMRKL